MAGSSLQRLRDASSKTERALLAMSKTASTRGLYSKTAEVLRIGHITTDDRVRIEDKFRPDQLAVRTCEVCIEDADASGSRQVPCRDELRR